MTVVYKCMLVSYLVYVGCDSEPLNSFGCYMVGVLVVLLGHWARCHAK